MDCPLYPGLSLESQIIPQENTLNRSQRKAHRRNVPLKARLFLSTFVVILLFVPWFHPAAAIAGVPVDNPSNVWAPYGPRVNSLQLNYYTNENTEFNDFETGHLDITDWPQAPTAYAAYDGNPDFVLSQAQGQFGMFGIDFNYGSSTWAYWGCNWQHGNSQCGIEVREALAHLIDRTSFVTDGALQGAGQALADPSPPAKDPSGSPLSTQCSWETVPAYRNCIFAFQLSSSPGGFAQPGSPDFCAAVNHLILAGIGLNNSTSSCAVDPNSPGLANIISHPIRFMVRNDDPFRLSLGIGLTSAINQLFGANVVQPTFGSIAQVRPIVFVSAPDGPTDDWDMYTMGWGLGGPFPDHLYPLYDGIFASNMCGGQPNGLSLNYGFVCIPGFDTYANAAAQTSDFNLFKTDTLAAYNQMGSHVANLPVYARGIRIAGLRSMAGLVNARGISYTNFWTLLYGHNNTAYTPSNSIYKFGGGSNTIRWGQRQGTSELNIFNALTQWEINAIGEVYDTLVASSPIEPGSIICWMCDTYDQSIDFQGNTHFLFELRQGVRWQDGVAVNASDIKFTLLNFRDVPAGGFVSNVALVQSVTILGPYLVDVTMQGQSISHIVNLAGVPIIPKHLWELPGDHTYGDVGKADPAKTSTGYDPITSGTFIGSGPYVCRSIFPNDIGKVGTGCVRNADGTRGGQAIFPGGAMLLQSFDRTGETGIGDPFLQYMRSYNTAWSTLSGTAAHSGLYQEFSWADRWNNDTVTVQDLASVAACSGLSAPAPACPASDSLGPIFSYWLKPAFHGGTGTIGSEVSTVAAHLDDTWVSPYSWSQDQRSQPGLPLENIVPFFP